MVPPDDSGAAALADALAQLYAVAPDEFVATRTRLVQEAKGDGDGALAKEIGGLRRPTVSAWVVNQVVRRRPATVAALREVGRRLRAAQGQLDAAALRDLRPDRDRLLDDWAAAATQVAADTGRPLAPAALDEVRGTVIAALAGDEATEAVASGHLTRALSYSGFGEVDLSEAVVRTSSGALLSVVPGDTPDEPGAATAAPGARKGRKAAGRHTSRRKAAEGKAAGEKATKGEEEAAAEKATRKAQEKAAEDEAAAAREAAERERVEAAKEVHAAAVEAAKEARLALDQARDRADETRWRVEELEDQLKKARAEHRAAEQTATEAARARRSADVEVARAEKAVRDAEAHRG